MASSLAAASRRTIGCTGDLGAVGFEFTINSSVPVIRGVRLPMPQSNPVMDMAKRRASKHSTSRSGDASFVVPEQEGLQLHRRRNLFQLVSLLIVAAIGVTIGWFVTDDRPDIAALVGGVLGMIVGTFVSGFILMLMPPPTIKITAHEFGRKHRGLKRHLIVASIAFAVFLFGLPFIISRFGHDDSDLAWVVCLMWIVLTVGLCAYTKGLALRIRECKCPACGETFGRISSHCSHCGLSIAPDGEEAIEQSDARETSAQSVLNSQSTPRPP